MVSSGIYRRSRTMQAYIKAIPLVIERKSEYPLQLRMYLLTAQS